MMKKLIAGIALTLMVSFVAMAADDIDAAYNDLTAAVDAKKTPAEIKPLAVAVLDIAAKLPDSTHAKEVAAQAEYALFTAASSATPAEQVDLIGALETADPKSKYLPSAYPMYLAALNKVAPAKVGPTIDKALTNFPDDQELMVAGANLALQKGQAGRAIALANKALSEHPKAPDGVDAAAWEKSQNQISTDMRWIAAVGQGMSNKWFECNKELRAVVPAVQGNPSQLGTAYFYLGVCNYQLGRTVGSKAQVLEGAKYSEMAAGVAGPLQHQAAANAATMKAAAAKMP